MPKAIAEEATLVSLPGGFWHLGTPEMLPGTSGRFAPSTDSAATDCEAGILRKTVRQTIDPNRALRVTP